MENNYKNCKKNKSNCSPQKPPCVATKPFRSLRDLCVEFVGQNIHLVDSLVDFPEIIGRELFDAACTAKKFTRPSDEAVSILGVFNEAYEEEILSELSCFVRRHVALETALECVQTFIYLQKLDIEGCHIGDEHELIPWIGNLQRLTHLGLGDNALSNDGVRKLTSPLRMFVNGPVGLKVLDLKYNPKITEGVIRYLTCLKTLDALDVTGCSITTKGVIKMQPQGFTLSETDVPVFSALCTTHGWAADMVAMWATTEDKVTGSKDKPRDNTKPTATSFYSARRRRLALASTLPQKCSPKPSKRLQLTRSVDSQTSINSNLKSQKTKIGEKLINGNSQSSNRKKGLQWSKVEIQRHLFQPGGESNDKRTNSDHTNNDGCDKPKTSNNKQTVSEVREPASSPDMDILQGYLVDKSGRGGQLTRTVDSQTSINSNFTLQRTKTGEKLIKGNSQSSNRKKGQQWSKGEIQRHLFQPGGESTDKRTNSDRIKNDNCDKPQTSNNKPDKQRVSKVREPASSNDMDILQGYLVDKSGGDGQPNTLWDVMKQW